jgi:hypothetical protein
MLTELFRSKQASRLRWLDEVSRQHPDGSAMLKVRVHAGLLPIGTDDGAVLVWIFDNHPGPHVLIVRLTEREADAVSAADPYTVGMLEPVRHSIASDWALLAVECEGSVHMTRYQIPRRGSEDEFIANLDAAAAGCPAYTRGHGRGVTVGQEEYARELARELALA